MYDNRVARTFNVRRLIALASQLKRVLALRRLSRGSTTPGVCGFEVPAEAFFGM
jgi:hypothetical protein